MEHASGSQGDDDETSLITARSWTEDDGVAETSYHGSSTDR